MTKIYRFSTLLIINAAYTTYNPFLFVLVADWVFIPTKKNVANHCQSHLIQVSLWSFLCCNLTSATAPPGSSRGRHVVPSRFASFTVHEPSCLLDLISNNSNSHFHLELGPAIFKAHLRSTTFQQSIRRLCCIWACRLYRFCTSLNLSSSSRNEGRFPGSLLKERALVSCQRGSIPC